MNWIWLSKQKFPDLQKSRYTIFCENAYECFAAYFVKTFNVEKKVSSAVVKISADTKYLLRINGKFVLRGPAELGGDYGNCEPLDYYFTDTEDISPYLKHGENKIEVTVQLNPIVMADYSMGKGGLAAEIKITFCDGDSLFIETDESWLSTKDNRYVRIARGMENCSIYDASADIGELYSSEKVNDVWHTEDKPILNKVYENITYKKVHTYFTDRIKEENGKITVSAGCPVIFTLDFGKVYSFYPNVKITGGENLRFSISSEETVDNSIYREILISNGNLSYEGITLLPGRYIKIKTPILYSPVTFDISMDFCCYPVENTGKFECDDEFLNELFECGKHAVKINRQSYHMDSPTHQEALGCTGDYMIESLIAYNVFGETALSRFDIVRTARLLEKKQGKMFHTSYSLLWTEMIMDYYMYSGDESIFAEVGTALNKLLKLFITYIGKSGVIEYAPNYMFVDWVEVNGFNLHHPPKVLGQGVLSAYLYKALKNGSFITKKLGDDVSSYLYDECAQKLKESFNSHLFDEKRGLYIDGKNCGDEKSDDFLPVGEGEYYSQHTNSLAVLYGIAPDELKQTIMKRVMEDNSLIQADAYFLHFIFNAVYKAGIFEEYGINLMYKCRSLITEAPGGFKESFYMPECDYSHAWGASAVYQMMTKILGVVPKTAGFEEFEFKPLLCGLKWARGSVPTPHGIIDVNINEKEASANLRKG